MQEQTISESGANYPCYYWPKILPFPAMIALLVFQVSLAVLRLLKPLSIHFGISAPSAEIWLNCLDEKNEELALAFSWHIQYLVITIFSFHFEGSQQIRANTLTPRCRTFHRYEVNCSRNYMFNISKLKKVE